jgi:hypothetical protein
VSIGADDVVIRLRTGFLKDAVTRIRGMVDAGETYEAVIAGAELRRYFEWVRETLAPEDGRALWQQIQTLPGNFNAR